MEIWEMKQSY